MKGMLIVFLLELEVTVILVAVVVIHQTSMSVGGMLERQENYVKAGKHSNFSLTFLPHLFGFYKYIVNCSPIIF